VNTSTKYHAIKGGLEFQLIHPVNKNCYLTYVDERVRISMMRAEMSEMASNNTMPVRSVLRIEVFLHVLCYIAFIWEFLDSESTLGSLKIRIQAGNLIGHTTSLSRSGFVFLAGILNADSSM
jgi:hypothetical protein